jgi:hypothetical protein
MATPTHFDISPSRLRLKRIARRAAVGLGRSLAGIATHRQASIRVLTYHRFGTSEFDPCCVRPQAFDSQLRWLAGHTSVLTPEQFDAAMSGESPVPPDAVLITIDDGHASVAAHALPALERHGLKAVLFVCAGMVGTERSDPRSCGGFMDWHALAGAAAAGHVVAAHGFSHRSLGRMPLPEAIDEIDAATAALATRLGTRSTFFSFPFGTRADYSADLAGALAGRGFRYCFTSTHGRCRPGSRSVLLPRIKIEGGSEDDLFPHIARGAMDHWRLVDRSLYHLQQRGRL